MAYINGKKILASVVTMDINEQITNSIIDRSITEVSSNTTKIGNYAFMGCTSLTSVNFPNATSIGMYAFKDCTNLTNANFPLVETTTSNFGIFQYCTNLTSVSLPLVKTIYGYAFMGCTSLTSVNLPAVTVINSSQAFYNCTSLTSVKLPLVYSIGNSTFNGCTSLINIYFGHIGVVSLTSTNVFNNGASNTIIHVRRNYANSYASATNWSSLISSGRITIVGDYSD